MQNPAPEFTDADLVYLTGLPAEYRSRLDDAYKSIDRELAKTRTERRREARTRLQAWRRQEILDALAKGAQKSVVRKALNLTNWNDWRRTVGPTN